MWRLLRGGSAGNLLLIRIFSPRGAGYTLRGLPGGNPQQYYNSELNRFAANLVLGRRQFLFVGGVIHGGVVNWVTSRSLDVINVIASKSDLCASSGTPSRPAKPIDAAKWVGI